ncbi:MAG: DUF2141 domain-containing protein [Gammaproteobacteria bacterium]
MREILAAGGSILLLLTGPAVGQEDAPDQEQPAGQDEPLAQEDTVDQEQQPPGQDEPPAQEEAPAGEEPLLQAAVPTAVLVIYIEGIEDTEGDVVVSLFDSSESFLNEPFLNHTTPPGDRSDFHVRFEEVPPGEYAVAVLQDLNGNGELERGLMGRAQEPIAFSNEVEFGFGPPEFAEAAFAVDAGLNEVVIRF